MKSIVFILFFLQSTGLVGQVDLQQPFIECGIEGSTTVYDYSKKKWISTNDTDSRVGTLPASTFKIMNTLIILQSGVISDEKEVIKFNGPVDTTKYGYRPDIYHDMDLREAFRTSAGWVYLELARKIGKEKYREILQKTKYGNADISIDDDDFWNFGNLAISPRNQIEILIGVYEESLPFSKRSFAILKETMKEEQTENYVLRAKTGWTRDGGKDTGWWIGYVERKDNVYFFATRLIKDRSVRNANFGSCRTDITKSVLKNLKILN